MDFLYYVLAYDVWFYMVHRLLHVPYLYKRYHYQHHAHTHPTCHDTFTAHAVENVFSGLGIVWPFLFGCSKYHGVAAWLFCFGRGIARHDRRCAWLFGTHHLQHHITPGVNFSAVYIDWLCGTRANMRKVNRKS